MRPDRITPVISAATSRTVPMVTRVGDEALGTEALQLHGAHKARITPTRPLTRQTMPALRGAGLVQLPEEVGGAHRRAAAGQPREGQDHVADECERHQ